MQNTTTIREVILSFSFLELMYMEKASDGRLKAFAHTFMWHLLTIMDLTILIIAAFWIAVYVMLNHAYDLSLWVIRKTSLLVLRLPLRTREWLERHANP